MKKTRPDVLIVSRIHMPEVAAASFRLAAVERGMRKARLSVHALTTRPPAPLTADDSWVTRLPVLRDKDGYVKGILNYLSFDIPAFFRLVLTERPRIILVEPPPTTGTVVRIAAALRRVPYVWYAADVWGDATQIMGASAPVVWGVRRMEKFVLRGAAGVIAVSEGVAERVKELGSVNTVVIPNGADTSVFHPAVEPMSTSELLSKGVRHPYFIYAGTASQWQGAEIFADAFADYWQPDRNRQFVMIGRGTSFDHFRTVASRLRQRAREAGLDYDPLIVMDQVDSTAAARWQRGALAATVSIKPDQGYDFAYPTKVLTALACGTPIIYSGVGAATIDIDQFDLGRAVSYDSRAVAREFARPWEELAGDDERRRRSQWVVNNRSMKATGEGAAQFIGSLID